MRTQTRSRINAGKPPQEEVAAAVKKWDTCPHCGQSVECYGEEGMLKLKDHPEANKAGKNCAGSNTLAPSPRRHMHPFQ